MSYWKILKSSESDWPRFVVARFPLDSQLAELLIDDAINRLENGDVSMTQYGIRVQVRPDLGDLHPTDAAAFWPKRDDTRFPRCACTAVREYGICAHVVAVRMYRENLEGCMESRSRRGDLQTHANERNAGESGAVREDEQETTDAGKVA